MVVVAVILIGGSFFGGVKYDQAQTAAARGARTGGRAGTFFAAGGGVRGGNTFAMGTILSKDANSITVQMADGSGSTIAFLTASIHASAQVVN